MKNAYHKVSLWKWRNEKINKSYNKYFNLSFPDSKKINHFQKPVLISRQQEDTLFSLDADSTNLPNMLESFLVKQKQWKIWKKFSNWVSNMPTRWKIGNCERKKLPFVMFLNFCAVTTCTEVISLEQSKVCELEWLDSSLHWEKIIHHRCKF